MTSEITRNEYPDLFRHFEEGKQLEDLMGESGAVWPILSLVRSSQEPALREPS